MALGVVGAGYVGLVVAACLADLGHAVRLVERDAVRLAALGRGEVPIFEPGLDDLLRRGLASGRLTLHADAVEAAADLEILFVAVGTPAGDDGAPDVRQVDEVVDAVGPTLASGALVVLKSTVPVGTADRVRARLAALDRTDLSVVSNPEFLAEGRAVDDFTQPDRVVLGVDDAHASQRMARLYAPLLRGGGQIFTMDNRSAELAKYASNAALATRVSLMNELATLCEAVGADVEWVRRVVGADARIGERYLFPGAGFGGSCFPKDLRALHALAAQERMPLAIVDAVLDVNRRQKQALFHKLEALLGGVAGHRIGVWGLAFKPGTDDLRQAPALVLVDALLDAGAEVVAHDPKAMAAAATRYGGRVRFVDTPADAAQDADALAIVTEWPAFRSAPWHMLGGLMRRRIVVDGRNLYDPDEAARAGFVYASIGRPVAHPAGSGSHPTADGEEPS